MSTTGTTIDLEQQMLGEVEMVGRDRWEEIHRRAGAGGSIRAIARVFGVTYFFRLASTILAGSGHPGRRCGRRQRDPCHPLLPQSPNLRIRDQPVLHEENGQCHTPRGCSRDRPIAASATGKNSCR